MAESIRNRHTHLQLAHHVWHARNDVLAQSVDVDASLLGLLHLQLARGLLVVNDDKGVIKCYAESLRMPIHRAYIQRQACSTPATFP